MRTSPARRHHPRRLRLQRLRRQATSHPVAAVMLWFFTVGQTVAFVPVIASAQGVELPAQPFATASTWVGLLLPALVLTGFERGREGVTAYLAGALRLPDRMSWFAVPLVVVPLVTLGVAAVTTSPRMQVTPEAAAAAYVSGLLLQGGIHLVTNNLWEELVWTGFVQARLQGRFTPLKAALLVAPLFALQHAALIAGNAPLTAAVVMAALVALAVPYRATMGWLYNRTGSLLLVGSAHAFGNATVTGTIAGAAFVPTLDENASGPLHLFAFALVGGAVCLATRGRLGGARPAPQPPHPQPGAKP